MARDTLLIGVIVHLLTEEAPLNLDTLEEAVRQCPKLQLVLLNDAPFDDQCFPILARISKLNMLSLMRGRQITGHGLELLKDLPLKNLFLQRTALNNKGLAGLFTKAERKSYEDARTYKIMKNRILLDHPELQASIHALREFFDDMNRWEQMAEQKGRWSFCGL